MKAETRRLIQLPFRYKSIESRLVKAKGSLMRTTGEKISNNEFFIQLLSKGLEDFEKRRKKVVAES
ncbi:MAG: hypothetical protein ACKOYP_14540 [Bacteroidota bacterium]